jgi:prolyl-tRNA synthetase
MVDGELSLILLRGDHLFQEQKFCDATSSVEVAPADEDIIKKALGASPGSLGAVGVDGIPIFADPALKGRSGMTTGANENDFHLSGVNIERDIKVNQWVDMRSIADGEGCPSCSEPLRVVRCIEAGHIFKLGRKYSEAMGVTVLDSDGKSQTPTMGSYGIGVGRAMAAIAETHCDESGLIWPISVAPYEVVITVVKTDDENSMKIADDIYTDLRTNGIDVLLDDREERPGVKFADAELIGIPLRVTIGPRGLENGVVEFLDRSDPEKGQVEIKIEEVKDFLSEKISSQ